MPDNANPAPSADNAALIVYHIDLVLSAVLTLPSSLLPASGAGTGVVSGAGVGCRCGEGWGRAVRGSSGV